MQDVRAHVKLQPICGTLSYSTILNSYKYRLGMTGTLECLTKVCATLAVNRDGSFGFVFFQERCAQVTKSTRLLPQLVIINFLHTFTMTFVFSGAKRAAFTIRLPPAHLPALHLRQKGAQRPGHHSGERIIRRIFQDHLGGHHT